MTKKYWTQNYILIAFVIILIIGLFFGQRYLLKTYINNPGQDLAGENALKKEIKEISNQQFDFLLFKSSVFKNLKEFISLPLIINNKNNNQPFQ